MTRQYFATELSELQAEITRLQQDLSDARTGWESAVEEVREQDEKIVRLTAELEKMREALAKSCDEQRGEYFPCQRVRQAEQQVAALVEAIKNFRTTAGKHDGEHGPYHGCCTRCDESYVLAEEVLDRTIRDLEA